MKRIRSSPELWTYAGRHLNEKRVITHTGPTGSPEPRSLSVLNIPYSPIAGHYDEMVNPDGSLRPHWVQLIDQLDALGQEELTSRVREARRILRDNGATYHAQKDADGEDRLWPLDLIPTVIEGTEWSLIESAVRQRARLLNEVLRDIYGPQRLIHEQLVPPEFVFAHPGFLRECHGLEPRGGTWLTTYAVDLARTPDGKWWFLSDRTETPTGSGYALENRLIVNRTLAEAFEDVGVRRLAAYFQRHRQSLTLPTPGRENPRVAVLTPGPSAATFFEHAYLARYLGYTLVEGSDLTVRNQRVHLKTLGGLLPVDTILRRQESRHCDPMEFGEDPAAGVPGLLDCIRAGTLTVANALGSGLAESPALMAFLPQIAQALFSEQLEIPSVATWWCGQAGPRSEVLARLEAMVIKPAFPEAERRRSFGRQMTPDQLRQLREDIDKNPHRFAAQEELSLSTTPVATGNGLEPRFLVVRAFAVSDGNSYTVMPGGLARVSRSATSLDVTVLSGGSSKDLWVLGTEPDRGLTLLKSRPQPVDVSRATFDLPSRIAENLYWLGRYSERIDATARLVRATLPLLFEESTRRSTSGLSGAFGFLRQMGYTRTDKGKKKKITDDLLEDEIRWAIAVSEERGSFGWQIDHMYRLAWMLQDRLSADAWKIISRLQNDYIVGRANTEFEHGLADVLDRVVMNLTAFGGEVAGGMTRGHGWSLLDIGRRLERSLQVIALLEHGLSTVAEDERARIELLLEAANVTITYRSRYLTALQADLTIDLLLIDDANPRAVAFQLNSLMEHFNNLPRSPDRGRHSMETKLLTSALAEVALAELDEVSLVQDGKRPGLEALLAKISADLSDLSDHLTRDYLTHLRFARPRPDQ